MTTPEPALSRHPPRDAGTVVAVLAAIVLGLFLGVGELSPWQATVATIFHALLIEALPWLLLGAILAAVMERVLGDDALPRLARRLGRWTVPAAVACSPLVPMCECGVVPVIRGLLARGLPLRAAVAWLAAGPILNPIVITTTWIAFDGRMALARALGGVVLGLGLAWWVARGRSATLLQPGVVPTAAVLHVGQALRGAQPVRLPAQPTPAGAAVRTVVHAASPRPSWSTLPADALRHTIDVAGPFVLGVIAASLLVATVDHARIAALGGHPLFGIPALMGGAVAASLCAEADAFVAASLPGVPRASLLAFLVIGPVVDLKLLLAWRAVFTTRMIVRLTVGALALTWLFAAVIGLWL